MAKDKFLEEEAAIRYFKEKYPAFPKGKLIKDESPDFILKTGRHYSIGIELTQIISPQHGFQNDFQFIDEVMKTILKKNGKLPLYSQKKTNEIWLIITCDDLNFQDNFRPEENLFTAGLKSGFNRIFLFDLFGGNVIEVDSF